MPTRVATEWMKSNFPEVHADSQKTFSILSASNQNQTQRKIMVSLEDCMGNKIIAGDIVTFVIQLLTDDTFRRESPFVANG
jgi:DNA replicative helicase MCM subunit Mcm2 (Cdc46/Mcm family)